MAIASARVQINGTWYNLALNSATGKWEGSVTAPSATSFHLTGGYYPVTVEATNQAGTKTTVTSADPAIGGSLRLVVKERVKPVVSITGPSAGAYLANNQQPVTFTLRDETGGSGVKLDTLAFVLDGTTYKSTASGMVCTAVTGGYDCTYTPPAALSDGSHTVSITVEDNDGNTSVAAAVSFTVDTVPPVLNLTSPVDGLITATPVQTVAGATNDATSSPVIVTISLNGVDQGAISVGEDGSFSKGITLSEGGNTIVITSTDKAGKATSVTLSAVLDTSSPVIGNIGISPNPADAGASLVISIEVS